MAIRGDDEDDPCLAEKRLNLFQQVHHISALAAIQIGNENRQA
jgi:hypothetical protein